MTTLEQAGDFVIGARLYHAESTIAKLKKIVLDDPYSHPGNDALLDKVRELVGLAKEYEDFLQEQKFRGGVE